MPLEDIAEVVASSFDRRFPPKNIFRQTIKSSDFNSIAGTEGYNHSFEGSSHLTPSSSGSNIGTIHNLGSSANGGLAHHSPGHSAMHSPSHSHSSGLVMPVAHRMIGKGSSYRDKAAVKGWICSGVVPQFVHVVFFEKWEIKKVSLQHFPYFPSFFIMFVPADINILLYTMMTTTADHCNHSLHFHRLKCFVRE